MEGDQSFKCIVSNEMNGVEYNETETLNFTVTSKFMTFNSFYQINIAT